MIKIKTLIQAQHSLDPSKNHSVSRTLTKNSSTRLHNSMSPPLVSSQAAMAGISKSCSSAATLELKTDHWVSFCSFSEADHLLPLHVGGGAVQPHTLKVAALPRQSDVRAFAVECVRRVNFQQSMNFSPNSRSLTSFKLTCYPPPPVKTGVINQHKAG